MQIQQNDEKTNVISMPTEQSIPTHIKNKHHYVVIGWFIFISLTFSLICLFQLSAKAHMINDAGLIRGETQRLVKDALHFTSDPTVLEHIEETYIAFEKEVSNPFISQTSRQEYITYWDSLTEQFKAIKAEIAAIEAGAGDIDTLYTLSEEHFELANEMVYYIEKDVLETSVIFISFYIILSVLSICFLIWLEKRKLAELEQSKDFDPLTNLYNLHGFYRQLNEILKRNDSESYLIAKFNVANFRSINYKFGFQTGDQVLCQIADKLIKEKNPNSIFARVTADHFFILTQNDEDVYEYLDRIVLATTKSYRTAFSVEESRVIVGLYRLKAEDNDAKEVANFAGTAHRYAKAHQLRYIVYDDALSAQITRNNYYIEHFDDALANNQLKLYLQPQVDLKTMQTISAESLVRWELSDGTLVYPDSFIPLFESTEMIQKLDFYMLRKVCAYLKALRDNQQPLFKIAVNFSRVTLNDDDFYETFQSIMQEYDLPPAYVGVEILENSFSSKTGNMLELLKKLNGSGYYVLMDDFGSGYSSLGFISQVSVHTIKFDRQFLMQYDREKNVKEILRYMILLAHSLQMSVICEGVETKEHVLLLQELNCEYAQGYYFAKPVPCEQFQEAIDAIQQKCHDKLLC